MPTLTPNYSLQKPIPGADDDFWGGYLNNALDTIDTTMKANDIEATVNTIYPVGSIYMSTNSTNPATVLGVGTWVAYAEGRVLVGAGSNGESTWTEGQERGSETHTLTNGEMPLHTHAVDPPATSTTESGDHSHAFSALGTFGNAVGVQYGGTLNANTALTTALAGNHTHTVDIAPFNSGGTGGGAAHNNVQPSLGVYMWERTA